MVITGLLIILLMVFILPFLVKKVEHNLEVFLFVMGVLSVTVSSMWSSGLVKESLMSPVNLHHPIVEVVFVSALIFKFLRPSIHHNIGRLASVLGYKWFIFLTVVMLGLVSSIITAIIASLLLIEIISVLKLDRKTEIHLVIISCFSIGLGAALTPVGEPLSTIAIAKLAGEPHNAGFFFLFNHLWKYIIPGIISLGIFAIIYLKNLRPAKDGLEPEDKSESYTEIIIRTLKVYIFIVALMLLGEGFKPVIDEYVTKIPYQLLYWINIVSAILDNATLTAAEISPAMNIDQIISILMGLLIAGGMLIPGNIPNIISAGKLRIKSTEWAKLGVPLGLVMMAVFFVLILAFH